MVCSQVKISCFRVKANLVFHYCLYNKVEVLLLNLKWQALFRNQT